MYIKSNGSPPFPPASPAHVRDNILCQFCNIHAVLFAYHRMDAAQILGAVISTKSSTSKNLSISGNLTARAKEQAISANGNSWENPAFTPRQRQIMSLLIKGETNKVIALTLSISQRTVENHRAVIMKKTGSKSFPALVSAALAAAETITWREAAVRNIACLTPRQRQIMESVLAGQPSKNIAADLSISQRTVESHRASIMKRTGAKSLSALTCLALAAA